MTSNPINGSRSFDERLRRTLVLLSVGVVVLLLGYGAALVAISWPIETFSVSSAADFAESFGIVVAILSAATFLIVVWAMLIQRKELELQRDEMRRLVAAQHENVFFDQVKLAMEYPELVAVYGFSDGADEIADRQHMFAHSIFNTWFHAFLQDIWTYSATYQEIERHFRQSEHFRNYWVRRKGVFLKFAEENSSKTLFEPEKVMEFVKLVESAYDVVCPVPDPAKKLEDLPGISGDK